MNPTDTIDTGNIGIRFRLTDEGAVELYFGDIDHNGRIEYFDTFDTKGLALNAVGELLTRRIVA